MDRLSKEKRSWNMSKIPSKDTKLEKTARSILHRMGFRFSLKQKNLPGKPDIVLPKYRTVIFVHGCFWHRHSKCYLATIPKSNKMFWSAKFKYNVKHDSAVQAELYKLGWNILIIWECEIKNDHLVNKLQRKFISLKSTPKIIIKKLITN